MNEGNAGILRRLRLLRMTAPRRVTLFGDATPWGGNHRAGPPGEANVAYITCLSLLTRPLACASIRPSCLTGGSAARPGRFARIADPQVAAAHARPAGRQSRQRPQVHRTAHREGQGPQPSQRPAHRPVRPRPARPSRDPWRHRRPLSARLDLRSSPAPLRQPHPAAPGPEPPPSQPGLVPADGPATADRAPQAVVASRKGAVRLDRLGSDGRLGN